MTVTDKLPGKGIGEKKSVAGTRVDDIVRQSRVEELRRLVASNRYEVNPYKLALNIMVRAMSRAE